MQEAQFQNSTIVVRQGIQDCSGMFRRSADGLIGLGRLVGDVLHVGDRGDLASQCLAPVRGEDSTSRRSQIGPHFGLGDSEAQWA
ncbi:Uncharacterised protein [Mycobacteroides abscessus subsp. abscessus]|nr:Uncharacterised protein [Mycobacteroides abscessus subsp. abscessus]